MPRSREATAEAAAVGLPRELLEHLVPLVRAWLPGRRWFAGKGRPVRSCEPVSAALLRPGDPALLHLVVRVGYDGAVDAYQRHEHYQLLLGARSDLPGRLAGAALGRIAGGTYDGLVVHDALFDRELTRHLLDRLAGAPPPGADGAPPRGVGFRRVPGAAVPSGLPGRLGTAEQTNTSVIFGDAVILKVFRRLEPGTNPDLELSLALDRAGCAGIPRPLAWLESVLPGSLAGGHGGGPQAGGGEATTLGLLQEFLTGGADGWDLALGSVRHACGGGGGGGFTGESHRLGRATAEVHRTLAEALGTRELARPQVERMAAGMARRLDAAAETIPQLRPHRAGLHEAFDALAALGERGIRVQRVHGDLHLGQVMRTPDGWRLIDFEGEPARPLAERRRRQPAVRDVAGMLRSYDYAASHLLAEAPAGADGDARRRSDPLLPGWPAPAGRGRAWAEANRAAFCAGYAAAGGDDPAADPVLLRAFETDKAVYEVAYEARHRPAWLPIPLAAVARLAGRAAPT